MKGQGALEYLLLIGGAILVATIIIAIFVGVFPSSNLVDVSDASSIIIHTKSGDKFKIIYTNAKFLDISKIIIIHPSEEGRPIRYIKGEDISYVDVYK